MKQTVALSLLLAAAVAHADSTEVQYIGDKNYTVGQEKHVYVGQPMIKAKTYAKVSTTATREILAADEPFTFSFSLLAASYSFNAGEEMREVGTTTHAGKEYRLVKMPHPALSNNLLMIDADGQFIGLVKAERKVVSAGANIFISTRPKKFRFSRRSFDESSSSDVFVNNFEIVYSGKSKDGISLLYREYTASDLARPAYTQVLSYEAGTERIRFRDIVMRAVAVDSEGIRFVVEQDAAPPPTP